MIFSKDNTLHTLIHKRDTISIYFSKTSLNFTPFFVMFPTYVILPFNESLERLNIWNNRTVITYDALMDRFEVIILSVIPSITVWSLALLTKFYVYFYTLHSLVELLGNRLEACIVFSYP